MRNRGHSRTPDPLHHTWTRYSEPGPPHPHVNPLFRTRAISSAREPAIPSLGNTAHMQNSGLTCGTEGLRAEQGHSRTPDPLHHTRTRYSEPGQPRPHAEQRVNMRNSGLTCETGGLRAEQQRAVPHGAARLACLRAAHEHCGTVRQRRRSAAESPGVMSLARATRSAAGSA